MLTEEQRLRLSNSENPQIMQVIRVSVCKGKGTEDSPYRRVIQYFTLNGEFLAEYDPHKEQTPRKDEV